MRDSDFCVAVVLPDGTEHPLNVSEMSISVVAGPDGRVTATFKALDVQLGRQPPPPSPYDVLRRPPTNGSTLTDSQS